MFLAFFFACILEIQCGSPGSRSEHAIARYEDKLFMYGGVKEFHDFDPPEVYCDLWSFSMTNKTWKFHDIGCQNNYVNELEQTSELLKQYPGSRSGHTFTTVGDDAFLFGGRASEHFYYYSSIYYAWYALSHCDLWLYELNNDQWSFIDVGCQGGSPWMFGEYEAEVKYPGSRANHATTNVLTSLFTFGGSVYEDGIYLNDLWEFDTITMKWIFREPLDESACPFGPLINDQFYEDPTINPCPSSRYGHMLLSYRNHLYLHGGYVSNPTTIPGQFVHWADTWSYNISSSVWKPLFTGLAPKDQIGDPTAENAPGSRVFFQYALADSQIIRYGGYSEVGIFQNDIWNLDVSEGSDFHWNFLSLPNCGSPEFPFPCENHPANFTTPSIGSRLASVMNYNEVDGKLYIFGGFGLNEVEADNLCDMWTFSFDCPDTTPCLKWEILPEGQGSCSYDYASKFNEIDPKELICEIGEFKESEEQCFKCVEGCQECTNENTCDGELCYSDYQYNNNTYLCECLDSGKLSLGDENKCVGECPEKYRSFNTPIDRCELCETNYDYCLVYELEEIINMLIEENFNQSLSISDVEDEVLDIMYDIDLINQKEFNQSLFIDSIILDFVEALAEITEINVNQSISIEEIRYIIEEELYYEIFILYQTDEAIFSMINATNMWNEQQDKYFEEFVTASTLWNTEQDAFLSEMYTNGMMLYYLINQTILKNVEQDIDIQELHDHMHDEVDTLRSDHIALITLLQQEDTTLHTRIDNLNTTIDVLKVEIDAYNEYQDSVHESIFDKLNTTIEDLKLEINAYNKYQDGVHKIVFDEIIRVETECEDDVALINTQLGVHSVDISDIRTQINGNIKDRLDGHDAKILEIENVNLDQFGEIGSLYNITDEQLIMIQNLQMEIHKINSENFFVLKALIDKNFDISELNITDLQKKDDELQMLIDDLLSKHDEQATLITDLTTEIEKNKNDANAQILALQKLIDAQKTQITSLTEDLTKTKTDLSNLAETHENDMKSLQDDIKDLNNRVPGDGFAANKALVTSSAVSSSVLLVLILISIIISVIISIVCVRLYVIEPKDDDFANQNSQPEQRGQLLFERPPRPREEKVDSPIREEEIELEEKKGRRSNVFKITSNGEQIGFELKRDGTFKIGDKSYLYDEVATLKKGKDKFELQMNDDTKIPFTMDEPQDIWTFEQIFVDLMSQ